MVLKAISSVKAVKSNQIEANNLSLDFIVT
jgi:hypothetical protein